MYQIIGVIEKNGNDGPFVNVRVNGTSKIFKKTAKELYETKWLQGFSREDAAYIGVLNAQECCEELRGSKKNVEKVKFPAQNVILLGMLFVCFLLMSNLTAMKVASISISNVFGIFLSGEIEFPAALVFFPITYLLSDVLTEVYGYKICRSIIWGGFICNAIFLGGIAVAANVPASTEWLKTHGNVVSSYETILSGYSRVFLASSIAYFFGEFINSYILAKLKIATSGKYFPVRIVGSTIVGVLVDSTIFIYIAFYGILTTKIILTMIFAQITFKVGYEILMLPLTYKITKFLKRKDGVDHYDFDTRFNPFSFKT